MAKSIKPPEDVLSLPMEVRVEMAAMAASVKLVRERLRDGSPLYIWRDGKVVNFPKEEREAFLAEYSDE